jgi:transposase
LVAAPALSERRLSLTVMVERGPKVGPKHRHGGTAMEHYAAIDVSLEWSSVCVVDAAGQIVREAKVRSEREALVAFFAQSGVGFARIGLGTGPLSQWLHAGLVEADCRRS